MPAALTMLPGFFFADTLNIFELPSNSETKSLQMKIYTRTGDAGSTGLFGGPRVSKDDARIEAYGTVDELNAAIGVVRAAGVDSAIDSQLETIQHELFSIGAELATPNPDQYQMRIIGESKHRTTGAMDRRARARAARTEKFCVAGR